MALTLRNLSSIVSKRASSISALTASAMLLLSLAGGALVLGIWQLRVDAYRDATEETGNLAIVLAGQLSRFVQALDIVLSETRDSLDLLDSEVPSVWRAALSGSAWHDRLRDKLARLPQAFNIAVADQSGDVLVSTAHWPAPKINIADRDYFQKARDQRLDALAISSPIRNRVNGDMTVVFARRMSDARGAFIGIVYVSVNTSYFEVVYDSIKSVRDFTFTLALTDGTMLVRHPMPKERAGQTIPSKSPWYETMAEGGGSYRSVGNFDGRARLVSLRPLQEYPLAVSVSTLEDTALGRWRTRSLVLSLGGCAFFACSLYLLVFARREMRSLAQSEISLRERSKSIEQSNIWFDAALNNMSQGLCMFDREQRVVVANTRYREMYGFGLDQVRPGTRLEDLSKTFVDLGDRSHDKDHHKPLEQHSRIESLRDGRVISISAMPMGDGGWVTTHEDVTERHRNEARVAFMARHDPLTGLHNRHCFLENLDSAVTKLREKGEAFSVLMLDLDRFKEVNDTLGHPAGDALLRQVAQRLRDSLPEVAVLARLGGDEFAIMHPSGLRREAEHVAARAINALTEPYEVNGSALTVGTSIGIAVAPEDTTDAAELIKFADLALYRAKSKSRSSFQFFQAEMIAELHARHQLEQELREAVSRSQFEVHYQTLLDVRTRKACGAEAVVRWRHPERGLVEPEEFIPFAEEIGLITAIGGWILAKACADAALWPEDIKLFVNVSPIQLKDANFVDVIVCALVKSGLPAHRLEIEITETATLSGGADYVGVMRQLKALGVMIVVDDFGTGYSSLTHLTMLPIDKIKIEKSFTQNMAKRSDCTAIVSAVLALGSGLGIKTIGEGVETEEQFFLLRTAGVDIVQGFLFSRPCPASELTFVTIDNARSEETAA